MKKFVYLYVGSGDESSQDMAAWEKWFGDLGAHLVDSGNPFGPGRATSTSGSSEMPHDHSTITGYNIINANDMDHAEALLRHCPMKSQVQIYECLPM